METEDVSEKDGDQLRPVEAEHVSKENSETEQCHPKETEPGSETNAEHMSLEEFEELCNQPPKKLAKEVVRDVWTVINALENLDDYTMSDVLTAANVTYAEFQESLQTLSTRNSIFHRRKLTDCWVNNYNPDLLRAWNANLDIQYVMDAYSCVAYILSYISKAEAEMGELLLNATKEAKEGNKDAQASMKHIGQVYSQNREVSGQESVYRVCGMHLKECSREVVFVPTGSNSVKMSLPINILKTRGKGDSDIWMASIIDKYLARPDDNDFNGMTLAEFCSQNTIHPRSKPPPQPTSRCQLPVYELQRNLGFIKQRKAGKQAVIRYPRFNKLKNPDEYYLSLIQLYVPHRQPIVKPPEFKDFEEYVRLGTEGEISLLQLINEKRKLFELDAEDLEKAWDDVQEGRIGQDAWALIAPEAEADRMEDERERELTIPHDIPEEESPDLEIFANPQAHQQNPRTAVEYHRPTISPREAQKCLRSMNKQQQDIFYKVRDWALQVAWNKHPEPFHLFVTGGAGTGKSHLIKCIYHEVTRILEKTAQNPESVSVLLTAPTGTAAFNIGGLTLHSAFAISKNTRLPYIPLGESILNTLRTKYDNIQLLVVDEISMVDHKLLTYVHGRLCQLKQSKKYFGNLAILAVGDFYQLPPVKASALYKVQATTFLDLWNPLFSIANLTQVMRQKEDTFAAMLNRLRVHNRGEPLLPEDLDTLSSVACETTPDAAQSVLHIFPTNKEVAAHNEVMVTSAGTPCVSSVAKDFSKNLVTGRMCPKDHPYSNSSPEDLLDVIKVRVGARIMLTRNIDIHDGLVNGAFGTITVLEQTNSAAIRAVYVKFDNPRCGKNLMAKTVSTIPGARGSVRIAPVEETLRYKNAMRRQLPLKLGWAATIHKVQGMTTDEIVVSLKKIFQPGMAYVALSRATSLAGLHIIDLDSKMIYASEEIKASLESMPEFLPEENATAVNQHVELNIVLHNTEGIIPHLHDILHAETFVNADILCFTETWLNANNNLPASFLPTFEAHTLHRNNAYSHVQRFFKDLASMERGGVASFVKEHNHTSRSELQVQNLEFVAVRVERPVDITIVTVYRPPVYSVQHFTKTLLDLLTAIDAQVHTPVMVLGDFNEDFFKQKSSIREIFQHHCYVQLVDRPTTEAGSCLDLVFVKGFHVNPSVSVSPLYYGFHDAVKISLLI